MLHQFNNNKSIANYIFSVGGTLSIALSLAVANDGGHCQQQDQLLHHTSMSLSYFFLPGTLLCTINNNTEKFVPSCVPDCCSTTASRAIATQPA